ncbi:hypothetical protein Dsin_025386 [Dipteronia sinensis]|uniref:Nucleolar protein 16 n=1 Tax=Dipteronia sinensis TaxID=43782 RepID=A0AAD9ZWA8_9ROSI|nr:hypothetical protein Dsin_025386 [Dipteronia sinensis]
MGRSRRKYKQSRTKVRVALPKKKPHVFKPAFTLPPKLRSLVDELPQWDDQGTVIRNYKSFGFVSNPNFLGVRSRTSHVVESDSLQLPPPSEEPASEFDPIDSGSDLEEDVDVKSALGKKRKDGKVAPLQPLTTMQRVHIGRLIERYGDNYQFSYSVSSDKGLLKARRFEKQTGCFGCKGVIRVQNMTFEELLACVQSIVKYDPNKYNIDLQSISIVPGTTCRTFIRNNDSVQFMLGEDMVIPQVCVSLIERRCGVEVKRSNKSVLHLVCKIYRKLRAVRKDEGTFFQVRSFESEHSCPLEEVYRRHRQASAVIIGAVIAPKLQHHDGRLMRPKDIISNMKIMFGIQAMYSKAHQALDYALVLTYGSHEETFQLLSSFGYVLEQQNPGTITYLQCTEDNKFLYFFMQIEASIRGF